MASLNVLKDHLGFIQVNVIRIYSDTLTQQNTFGQENMLCLIFRPNFYLYMLSDLPTGIRVRGIFCQTSTCSLSNTLIGGQQLCKCELGFPEKENIVLSDHNQV